MEPVLITQRAKWNLQEIIPIVIVAGIGALSIVLGITEVFVPRGAIVMAAIGFGLALYIFFVSMRRKWKSTLFAKVVNDKNLNIQVWMREPKEDKWQGKLDEDGNNKGKLSRIRSIKFDSIKGTRVLVVNTLDGNPIWIPVRLAETDEMRNILAKAAELHGGKLKFDSPENAKEFRALLSGASYTAPEAELKDYEKPTSGSKKAPAAKSEPFDFSAGKSDDEGVSKFASLEEESARPKTKIDYSAYNRVPTSDIITKAIADAETRALEADKEEEHKQVNVATVDPFLSGSNTSISIDLGGDKK